jgi:hypothetical protein
MEKKLKIKVIECKTPETADSVYWDISYLTTFDIERLESLGVEKAWYWYSQGSYEGSGQLLMLKDGLYYTHDMGHCSCYGPTDNLELQNGKVLEALEASSSKEYWQSILPLVKKARAAEKRVKK